MNSSAINLMRTFAIFMVIVVHVCAAPFKVMDASWLSINVVDSLARWCVPVFFMLSGALLLGKNEPLSVFFKKRIIKIILPLVFWSYVYLIFSRYFSHLDTDHAYPNVSFKIKDVIRGPAYFHLWFIYAIITIYIATPMMRALVQVASKQLVSYCLICWVIGASILPTLEDTGILKNNFFYYNFDFLPQYLGYFLLGFFLSKYYDKVNNLVGYFLTILGWSCTFLLTTYQKTGKHVPIDLFYSYLSPNVIIMSIGIFIVISKFKDESKIIASLGNCSFGIYLSHMLVMPLVWLMVPNINNTAIAASGWYSPLLIIISSLLVFLLSYVVVLILKRGKITRWVV